MTAKPHLFYVGVAALLSFGANVALLVAYFLLPDGWDFAWSTLRILAFPGDTIVDGLIGSAHGLGLFGVGAAFAANFLLDWVLIYLLMLLASYPKGKRRGAFG
jgi:hypothetical protein